MSSFLDGFIDYLRLKAIATILPWRLAKAYGGGERYTAQQVKRAILDLRLRKGLTPYALAAACSLEEVQRAGAEISAERYRQLRAEIANTFNLPANFTMKHLRRAAPSSAGMPASGLGILLSLPGRLRNRLLLIALFLAGPSLGRPQNSRFWSDWPPVPSGSNQEGWGGDGGGGSDGGAGG